MPTLKSNLTASTPRLCTDCLLCFIRSRISPDYILCTELAHHHHNLGFYWNFHLVSSLKKSSGSTSTLLLLKIPSTSFLNLQKIFFCSYKGD
nr:MAG TPA: hypothetical protein [Caudoviricetes sp.]